VESILEPPKARILIIARLMSNLDASERAFTVILRKKGLAIERSLDIARKSVDL
jgi:hypothetical protein